MASAINNNLYTVDPQTQFYSVNLNQVTNALVQHNAAAQVTHDARIEVFKSIAHYLIAGAVTLAVATIAIVAFKVGAFVIGILAFPLAIIPPVYSLATTFAGLVVGGIVGYVIFNKYATQFIEQGKLHWNHSKHLYAQRELVKAHPVSLHMADC